MNIKWIGQAGVVIKTKELSIIVDPYLSDSCHKINPLSYRRYPADESLLKGKYDVIIFTHDHLDHLDTETYPHILENNPNIIVLAPKNAWDKVRTWGVGPNYVMFNNGTTWTEKDTVFKAVKAEHSDLTAIGVIIENKGKTVYLTGDTLYNEEVFKTLPENIDYCIMPVNGKGNNMNMADGAKFADKCKAKHIVPVHVGLFDDLKPDDFEHKNKVVFELNKEYEI